MNLTKRNPRQKICFKNWKCFTNIKDLVSLRNWFGVLCHGNDRNSLSCFSLPCDLPPDAGFALLIVPPYVFPSGYYITLALGMPHIPRRCLVPASSYGQCNPLPMDRSHLHSLSALYPALQATQNTMTPCTIVVQWCEDVLKMPKS